MKVFILLLAILGVTSAHAECRFNDWVLKDFTQTPGTLAQCNYPLYHANGRLAFAPETRNWYHSNGAVAFWSVSGNWYHANGVAAFWAQTGNWYHANGEAAYWASSGNWFHANKQPAYWAQNGYWYHANNAIAYNAVTGNWFYSNGTFAGSSPKAIPMQAVEFLLNQSCQVSTSILCIVARYH